ncbi:hypothetical protein INR49_005316 [Caranx melampygus]|nr:hypothetical protein INR49_005316 [Caranx melampygus]
MLHVQRSGGGALEVVVRMSFSRFPSRSLPFFSFGGVACFSMFLNAASFLFIFLASSFSRSRSLASAFSSSYTKGVGNPSASSTLKLAHCQGHQSIRPCPSARHKDFHLTAKPKSAKAAQPPVDVISRLTPLDICPTFSFSSSLNACLASSFVFHLPLFLGDLNTEAELSEDVTGVSAGLTSVQLLSHTAVQESAADVRRLQPKKNMPKTTVRDRTHMTAIWTTLMMKRLLSSGAAATKPLSVTTEEKLQHRNSSTPVTLHFKKASLD